MSIDSAVWPTCVPSLWLNSSAPAVFPASPFTKLSYVRQSQSRWTSRAVLLWMTSLHGQFCIPSVHLFSIDPTQLLFHPHSCTRNLAGRRGGGTISHFRSHLLPISRRKVVSCGGSGESCCVRFPPGDRRSQARTAEMLPPRPVGTVCGFCCSVWLCKAHRLLFSSFLFYRWLQWGGYRWSKPRPLQAVLTLHSTAGARGRIPEMRHSVTHHPCPGYHKRGGGSDGIEYRGKSPSSPITHICQTQSKNYFNQKK